MQFLLVFLFFCLLEFLSTFYLDQIGQEMQYSPNSGTHSIIIIKIIIIIIIVIISGRNLILGYGWIERDTRPPRGPLLQHSPFPPNPLPVINASFCPP